MVHRQVFCAFDASDYPEVVIAESQSQQES